MTAGVCHNWKILPVVVAMSIVSVVSPATPMMTNLKIPNVPDSIVDIKGDAAECPHCCLPFAFFSSPVLKTNLLMSRNACFIIACFALATVASTPSTGHEVDQYSVPIGESLLDMGDYWNQMLYGVVSRGVEQANKNIAAEKNSWLPDLGETRLARQQSPAALAKCVRQQLPSALSLIENVEDSLEATNYRDVTSGRRLAYRAEKEESVYLHGPGVPDPRHYNRLLFMRCSTIKVHGHYFGTDKIGHFFAMGYHYYSAYQAARLMGQTHELAMQKAADVCGWVTESSFLGITSTGIYSNADMATNYTGLKFYLNLTQPVKLQGHMVPAMVVRKGEYWKLREHFSVESPLFAQYVSVHWDEVLNPCYLDETVRAPARRAIKSRSRQLLDWYAGNDSRRRTRAYFDNILKHCTTYYGENYGHSGDVEWLLGLGTLCFDTATAPVDDPVVRGNRSSLRWSETPRRPSVRAAANSFRH